MPFDLDAWLDRSPPPAPPRPPPPTQRYFVRQGAGTQSFAATSDEAAIEIADGMNNVGPRSSANCRPPHVAVWAIAADGSTTPVTDEARSRG